MAFVHGKDAVFKIDDSGGVLRDLSAYSDNIEFAYSVDMGETSTFAVEAKTYVSGLSDSTFTVSGKYDSTVTTGPDVVLSGLVGAEATSTFECGPEGGTTGKIRYTGEAFLTGYAFSAPVGDVVTWTADFQTSGAVTRNTF